MRIETSYDRIEEASKVEEVFSIESWAHPTKEDEVAAQIVAGNYAGNVVAAPGYDPLTQFGVNGQNVTVSVVDDGVGIPGDGGFYVTAGNAINGPLRGATVGAQGHGHLQASIIAGDTPSQCRSERLQLRKRDRAEVQHNQHPSAPNGLYRH